MKKIEQIIMNRQELKIFLKANKLRVTGKKNNVPLSLFISKDLNDHLVRLASKYKTTKAEFVRLLIESFEA